jgi:transposase
MFDRSDDTSVRQPRRVEVITGPERRRNWPDAEKIAIVAKALESGVNVSEVARQHDLNPQQLFGWRKRWRAEAEALIEAQRSPATPMFAPVVIDAGSPLPPPVAATSVDAGTIEISIGVAKVRIHGAADAKTLAVVLKALRALA